MLFREVVGQENAKGLLRQSVLEERVPHALLFAGAEGVGTLPLALAFAQYLACPNRTEEDACGTCPTCRKMQKLMHPDLHFCAPLISGQESADPATAQNETLNRLREQMGISPYFTEMEWYELLGDSKKQGIISANASARILEMLWFKSFELPYKFMVIWLPERMHPAAANRLLKIVEEPPTGTIFLFASTHPDEILPTIQSRVQRILLPPLEPEAMAKALIAQRGIPPNKAEELARAAGGSYTLALEFAEEEIETPYLELQKELYRRALLRRYDLMLEWVEMVVKLSREQQKSMLRYFARLLREMYVLNLGQESLCHLLGAERTFSEQMSPFVDGRNVAWLLDEYSLTLQEISRNGNATIVFTDFAMRHCRLLPKYVQQT